MQIIKKLWSQYVFHSSKKFCGNDIKLHFMSSRGPTSGISTDNRSSLHSLSLMYFPLKSMWLIPCLRFENLKHNCGQFWTKVYEIDQWLPYKDLVSHLHFKIIVHLQKCWSDYGLIIYMRVLESGRYISVFTLDM